MKKEKLQKIEKALHSLRGVGVMLETFAKMLIIVMVLYFLGTKTTSLTTFQVVCVNVAMLYWVMLPTFRLIREVFFK